MKQFYLKRKKRLSRMKFNVKEFLKKRKLACEAYIPVQADSTTTKKFVQRKVSDHLILSRYVCSNIVANIVTNIYMYVMRHVRT